MHSATLTTSAPRKPNLATKVLWAAIAIAGACCLGVVALRRGEPVNAIWIVTAAIAVFLIAHRFYSRFIADKVLELDPSRATPAVLRNDGLDYVPTHKWVVFGHHFAAIAGAGPLVGPVLAAQMGYLPGMLWILVGVVFAGAVQDFMILGLSLRHGGRSLGQMLREELGEAPGVVAMVGVLVLMMIVLAVLALVVVKALTHSPWGTFTVACTIPIALLMGAYLRFIRPGRILEVSLIGLVLLLASIWFGAHVAASPALASWFDFDARKLAWLLIGYGFFASVLPVWLLLAPRDYLSTFLKIGTIILLALAIILSAPRLQMPAITRFIDGTGPVFAGSVFPFLFITIACGAVSGWHSIIASGTTPKLLASEGQARLVGYGGMLMEAFVAIMALIAAASLHPGVYFAMNSPSALDRHHGRVRRGDHQQLGLPDHARRAQRYRAEDRRGHAAQPRRWRADAGGGHGAAAAQHPARRTHDGVLVPLRDPVRGALHPDHGRRRHAGRALHDPGDRRSDSRAAETNRILDQQRLATVVCVGLWGYFLYQGAVDPLGGINTLWPLFGIANQMLAAIALLLATVVTVKLKRQRYVWVPGVPAAWLVVCTLTAGAQKLFSDKISFTAAAQKYANAMAQGRLLAPAKTLAEMERIVTNNRVDVALTAAFMLLVIVMLLFSVRAVVRGWRVNQPTAREEPYVALASVAVVPGAHP